MKFSMNKTVGDFNAGENEPYLEFFRFEPALGNFLKEVTYFENP